MRGLTQNPVGYSVALPLHGFSLSQITCWMGDQIDTCDACDFVIEFVVL